MNEIAETIVYKPDEDSTEALLEQYEDGQNRRLDDVITTQAVICVLAAAALFAANLFCPDTADKLFQQLKHCMTDTAYTVPNPIDYIISYLQSR
jgi:hypothetical protein